MLTRGDFTREILDKLTPEQKLYLYSMTKRVFPDALTKSRIKIQGCVLLRCIYGYPDNYDRIKGKITQEDRDVLRSN